MKKFILLAETLFVVGGIGCGSPAQDAAATPDTVQPAADFAPPPGEDTAPSMADTAAPASGSAQVSAEALTVPNCAALTPTSVIASGDDGDVPGNTLDDRLDTRWSSLGKGQWIDYDLGSMKAVSGISVAWHEGNTRANTFAISTSPDGYTYTQVYSGKSSGTTAAAETYSFPSLTTRRVRITVQGNTLNDWASIDEARPCSGSTVTPPPPTPSGASVVWRGDFETGDRSQWSKTQMMSADRLQLVSSPTREGKYAIKVTVKQGDDPINSGGNRNELLRLTYEPSGSEYFYKWSTMFDASYPSAKAWQVFTQWHHTGNDGSPPVEFDVYGEEMRLNIGGSPGVIVWRSPLVRSQWQDFVFHVKWSSDPKVGFVELYLNGKLVMPKRYIATQFPGQSQYLKVGLYRNSVIAPTGIVYHDGWTMAKQLSDVLPSAASAPVAAAAAE